MHRPRDRSSPIASKSTARPSLFPATPSGWKTWWIGREADLMISECYSFEKRVPFHLDYVTLKANLPRIKPKRLILTHLNADTLARVDAEALACATAID